MNAEETLKLSLSVIPNNSRKEVLTLLAPYFNPEMLAASVEYLERYEPTPVPPHLRAELIFELIAEFTGNLHFRTSKTKLNEFVFARYLAMLAIKHEVPEYSLKTIGKLFNPSYNHATVIHGLKHMANRYSIDKTTRQVLTHLCEILAQNGLYATAEALSKIAIVR